jgi:hypothetical protein
MMCLSKSSVTLPLVEQSTVLVACGSDAGYALLFDRNFSLWWKRKLANVHLPICLNLALPARVVVYAGVILAAIGFAPLSESPFIYFQF